MCFDWFVGFVGVGGECCLCVGELCGCDGLGDDDGVC